MKIENNMSQDYLNDLKQAEAQYFDNITDQRTTNGHIPVEADIRRATRFIPKRGEKLPLIDPKMTAILDGGTRDKFIDLVAHKPGGRVLDIGCGSGWLVLELGSRGQHVDAYDISPKAITLAKQMLAENPYKDGFGEVKYYLQDVSQVDLGEEKYDAISGWSTFHHMSDFTAFMNRVKRALKPGGIIATMDDLERGRMEYGFEYFFEFILPMVSHSYPQKISMVFQLLLGKMKFRTEFFTPMEEAKISSVEDIKKIFYEEYDVVFNKEQNAFVGTPLMRLSGPDSFRYPIARALCAFDRFMCSLGIVKGFERIMVARKRT